LSLLLEYSGRIQGCLWRQGVRILFDGQPRSPGPTAGEAIAGLGQLMNRLSGWQTGFVNRQESRTGRSGRAATSQARSRRMPNLLACCRYVELNPVRARITRDPGAYTWSSYRRHAGTKNEFPWVDTDPCYLALGSSDRERTLRYMDFVREVEAIIGRRIENRKMGTTYNDSHIIKCDGCESTQ